MASAEGNSELSLCDGQRHPLALVVCALLVGAGYDRLRGLSSTSWVCIGAAALSMWLVAHWHNARRLATVLLLVGAVAIGGARHHQYWHLFATHHVGLVAGEQSYPVCLEGYALTDGRTQAARDAQWGPPIGVATKLWIQVRRVRNGATWQRSSGVGQLRVEGVLEHVHGGARIRVLGFLRAPSQPANPGDFDYATRLRVDRELFQLDAPHPECVLILESAKWWSPRRNLEAVRSHGRQMLQSYLTPSSADLAAALLLGARERLNPETVESFFYTGTIHLLAISGMHLSILLYGIWLAMHCGLVSRVWAMLLAAGLVIPYAIVTECQPPVIRAAAFVIVICGGRLMVRPTLNWNLFAVAALSVFVLNPAHIFHVGVHLSFLAVGALNYCTQWFAFPVRDPLQRLILRTEPWPQRWTRRLLLWVTRLCLTSGVIWLLTLPLIAWHYHLVSPATIVLNPLLWPPTGAAMFSGFGVLLTGSWLPPVALVLGWICEGSLQTTQWLVEHAAHSTGSHFWIPAPPLWWVIGFYLLVSAWVAFPGARPAARRAVAIQVSWWLIGIIAIASAGYLRRSDRLCCTFYAVGHGTCVLLELPGGPVLLYDAGHLGPPQSVVRMVSHDLWSRGIYRLHGIVISHADADHFNAVPDLVERFFVERVYLPEHMEHHASELVVNLRRHLDQRSIAATLLYDNMHIRVPLPVQIDVLHPPAGMHEGSDNAKSIVLVVRYAGRALLLPGDLESPGLERLMQGPSQSYDIVMAPHHGSARSDPGGFARWTSPRWLIISGGRPAPQSVIDAYQHEGARVVETARQGAVRVEITRTGEIDIRGFREQPW